MEDSELVVINSTLSGNSVDDGPGSAVMARRSNVQLVHVTIADNINPSGWLGHVYVEGSSESPGNLNMVNSLVVNNRCSNANFGTLYSTNSPATHESCTGQAMPDAAIQLGPLADNGGPSRAHALGSGSVAINAGGNCVAGFAAKRSPTRYKLQND